jgi:hypothetical protein
MQPHAEAHALEVDGGVQPQRPFKLDEPVMLALAAAGVLRTFIARDMAGVLVGYFTWNISLDIESAGLLIAQQGAWYVAPGHQGAATSLWDLAVCELRRSGVKCIYPHHRQQGRGSGIGRFFRRRGAKEIQRTYSLWIGE